MRVTWKRRVRRAPSKCSQILVSIAIVSIAGKYAVACASGTVPAALASVGVHCVAPGYIYTYTCTFRVAAWVHGVAA